MKEFSRSRKGRECGGFVEETMISDIVIQILRSNTAKAMQEGFEALVIRIHVLDVINLFGHVTFLSRVHLFVRQLLFAGVLAERWLFIGTENDARLEPRCEQ